MKTKIQLRFFASVREMLGVSQEEVHLPPHIDTVGKVRTFLIERGGVWEEALNENRLLRMACNQQMCDATMALCDGDEIAFFPPVTGG